MLRYQRIWFTIVLWALKCLLVTCVPPVQAPLRRPLSEASSNHDVSPEVFADLEESSRIVDIAYCVGLTGTGIQKPFLCASRCQEFANFELVTVGNVSSLVRPTEWLTDFGCHRPGTRVFFYLIAAVI